MELTDEQHDSLLRYGTRRDRYFLIEPDGERESFRAFAQRPAAERNARHGVGVYDAKERTVIVEPDLERRCHELVGTAKYHDKKANDARVKIARLRQRAGEEQLA